MVVDFVVDLSCQIKVVSLSSKSWRVISASIQYCLKSEHIEILTNTLLNVR